MDDVLADGGIVCSVECLIVGGAASSHVSCQRRTKSTNNIGIHTVSRGGKGTYDFVMSRSRSAAAVVPRVLVSAAGKASESSFSAR